MQDEHLGVRNQYLSMQDEYLRVQNQFLDVQDRYLSIADLFLCLQDAYLCKHKGCLTIRNCLRVFAKRGNGHK